jgi:hypothetical protein
VKLQISYDLRSVKFPGCVIATLHVKLSLEQSIAVVDKTSNITKFVYGSTEKLSITLMQMTWFNVQNSPREFCDDVLICPHSI